MEFNKLRQEEYNRKGYKISIIAIIISLIAIIFPIIKEKYIDSAEIFCYTSNYLTLSQFYGNPSLMLPITFVNTGKKPSLVKKIDIKLYSANNEIILKGKQGEIYGQYASYPQNVIALSPISESSFNIYLRLNDDESEEKRNRVRLLENLSIEDLKNQNGLILRANILSQDLSIKTNIEITDSVFQQIRDFCYSNLSTLKTGDYKILYYLYFDNSSEPQQIVGKWFKISEGNISQLRKSISNYKTGAQLNVDYSDKLLYKEGVMIRCYDLTDEDIRILTKNR